VIISLTTIPSRVEYIKPCIDSLLQQGLPIHIWLPDVVRRTGKKFRVIPGFLYSEGIEVHIVEDLGPITKLLPALKAGFKEVITADDDRIYGKGWANGLIKYSNEYPDSVICYRGRILNGPNYSKSKLVGRPKKVTEVDLVTGTFGALYKDRFFSKEIFNEWEQWERNDDLVVSTHLKNRGIRILAVPCNCKIRHTKASKINNLFAKNKRLNTKGIKELGLE